jgi:hypothetical protein
MSANLYNDPVAVNTRKVLPGEYFGRSMRYLLIEDVSGDFFGDDPSLSNSTWARAVRTLQGQTEVFAAYLPYYSQDISDYYDEANSFVMIVADNTAEGGNYGFYENSDPVPGNNDVLNFTYALWNEFQQNSVFAYEMYWEGPVLLYKNQPPELKTQALTYKGKFKKNPG